MNSTRLAPEQLRSHRWFGPNDLRSFGHRSRALRGYLSLFLNEVTQADEGCDFRFLHAGAPTPEPAIHSTI